MKEKAVKEKAVKERPILMSGPMVRAILDGRKTQTRRVLKPQPCPDPARMEAMGEEGYANIPGHAFVPTSSSGKVGIFQPPFYFCPYGQPGDRLWVRETFFCNSSDYPEPTEHARENLYCRADGHHTRDCEQEDLDNHWKPSIFMPRWASRLTLEITDVRVERLRNISEGGIFAEGVGPDPADMDDWSMVDDTREDFARLWDSLNAGRGFGWNTNCWVFVLAFKKVESKKVESKKVESKKVEREQ